MGKNDRQTRYNKAHTKLIPFRLNLCTDKDILERLEQVGNRQGYIKRLIREDIAKEA